MERLRQHESAELMVAATETRKQVSLAADSSREQGGSSGVVATVEVVLSLQAAQVSGSMCWSDPSSA